MVGRFTNESQETRKDEHITRFDLAVLSLLSLLFGLAVIARGLIHGG
jgi:hypothetical protein